MKLFRLFALLALLLLAGPTFSQTLVQQVDNNDGNATAVIDYGSNVAANNLGILYVRDSGGGALSVTDSLGSTWIRVGTAQTISGATAIDMFYTVFGSSGANTVTITGSGGGPRMLIQEVNGLGSGATLDSTNAATGTGTAAASGTISPAVSTWIFVGLAMTNYPSVAPTGGSGYTLLAEGNKYAGEYRSATSGTFNGDFTLPESNTWAAKIAAFKAGAGGGTGMIKKRRKH